MTYATSSFRRTARALGVVVGLATVVGVAPLAAPPASAAVATVAGSSAVAATAGRDLARTSSYVVPVGSKFVSTTGSDTAAGTSTAPLRTLAQAVKSVPAGGTVVMRAGSYHESVEVPIYKKVAIMSYPGETVWLDGSRTLTAWTAEGTAWRTAWDVPMDHTTSQAATTAEAPLASYPEQVFLDGLALKQVGSRTAVTAGTFWVDTTNKRLYVGSSPTGHEVRSSDLDEALYFNQGDGSSLRGIGVRRYAVPHSRMGAVKAYADDMLIQDVAIVDNSTTGLSMDGARITVRNSTVSRNGKLGIGGQHADSLVLQGNRVEGNNSEHFDTLPVAGGVKVTRSRTVLVKGNVVSDNWGKALWFDESCKDIQVLSNRLQRNYRHGVELEISAIALVANNLITDNASVGVQVVDTDRTRIYNNTFVNNKRHIDIVDTTRVITDMTVPGHDGRYPSDPDMTWVIRSGTVRNNIMQGAAEGTQSLVQVNDATQKRTGAQMGVSINYDAYYRATTTSPAWLAVWSNYPSSPGVPTTLLDLRTRFAQEVSGRERVGGTPWVSGTEYAVTDPAALPLAVALPTDIASLLGSTTAVRVGLVG